MNFSRILKPLSTLLFVAALLLSSCDMQQPVTLSPATPAPPTSTPSPVPPPPTLMPTLTVTPIPENITDGELVLSLDFFGDLNYDLYALDLSCMALPGGCSVANLVRLTDITGFVMYPDISPDGRQIAFMSEEELGGSFLFSMDVNGSHVEQLLEGRGAYPRWSPGGDVLAFQADRSDEGPLGATDIYLVDLGTAEETNLSSDPFSTDAWPTWSPDGDRIAFTSNRDGDYEIYTMDRNGEIVVQLTDNTFDDDAPAWSNDGQYIVYVTYQNGVGSDLVIMDAAGATRTVIASGPDDDNFPSWSPDDRLIAFWSTRGDGGLYLVDLQSGDVLQVLSLEGSLGSIGLGGPVAWMP
ncbi:MAG: PD40 domain-containing protein [Anaerolineae bacterium]|nr:PD40 domain-containing protein [Anaerolineae bacterium]